MLRTFNCGIGMIADPPMPDFRARLQHGGADRGRESRGLSGRDRAGLSNMPDAGGWRARVRRNRDEVVDHKPFGKDREAFDARCTRRSKRTASTSCALRDSCACSRPGSSSAGRAPDQHPSVALARLQGTAHPRARACGRREQHGATVHFVVPSSIRARSSNRRACRCCPATRPTRWPRACSRSSIASIRSRSGALPKAAPDERANKKPPAARPGATGLGRNLPRQAASGDLEILRRALPAIADEFILHSLTFVERA
jgi:hypothetical protein